MASSNNSYDAQASTNYKEAFALFDKRGTQRVALDSLGDLLRACGQNPTLAEIRDLEKNVGGDCMWIFFSASSLPTSFAGGSIYPCSLSFSPEAYQVDQMLSSAPRSRF